MRTVVATVSFLVWLTLHSLAQSWFEIESIVYEDPNLSRQFGGVLAIDGATLIVTDFQESKDIRNYGAAFVYQKNGNIWERTATWRPENLGFSAEFGTSATIDGDTVAVGSPNADFTISEGFSGDGQVFVYERQGETWSGPTIVFPNDQSRGDYGAAVALSGDTLAVGAPRRNGVAGEVVIYNRNGDAWDEVVILQDVETRRPNDAFGQALHFIDPRTLAIGIPGKDSQDGAVAIFTLENATWSHSQTLRIDMPPFSTRFGLALAHHNGTLVVGAPDDEGYGAAYLYERAGNTWTFLQKLVASNQDFDDAFGTSVAISGNTILVGAPEEDAVGFLPNHNQEDNTLRNTGAIYHFTRTGNTWEETAFLKSPSGENLGLAVALDGPAAIAGGSNEFITFAPGAPRDFIELQLAAYSPDLETPFAGPGTFGFDERWPIRILNSLLSTTANSMRLDLTDEGTFQDGDCVCVVISDPFGNLPDFTEVSLNPITTLEGFDASRLTFDANTITLNAQGISFKNGDILQIDLEFAGSVGGQQPEITRYVRNDTEHTIDFTGDAGRSDWQIFGSPTLLSFPTDHTGDSSIESVQAGRYRAILTLPQITSSSYFFRLQ